MKITTFTKTQKLTISGMVMALYIAILFTTQSISFGPVQIRIATTLYALSYYFPFLIVPLGLANLISNFLFGGLGLLDMLGGCFVGMVTTFLIVQIRQRHWNIWLCALPILLVPGLLVPIWLSYLLHLPYLPLAVSVTAGQAVPAICGVLVIQALSHIIREGGVGA